MIEEIILEDLEEKELNVVDKIGSVDIHSLTGDLDIALMDQISRWDDYEGAGEAF